MGSEQTDERQFDRIADAIEAIRRGEIVVVTDLMACRVTRLVD